MTIGFPIALLTTVCVMEKSASLVPFAGNIFLSSLRVSRERLNLLHNQLIIAVFNSLVPRVVGYVDMLLIFSSNSLVINFGALCFGSPIANVIADFFVLTLHLLSKFLSFSKG